MLLGGSPLRLFRISERAQGLLARWRAGAPLGADGPAQLLARRLVSAGAFVPLPGPPTLGPEDVTVVVPVRDRPVELDRLLGALGDLACVVVDDASADGGATKAIAERHGARFVGLAVNGGPSVARNAGLDAVDSALVAFVDSDCVPAAGWLAPLLGHFDDPRGGSGGAAHRPVGTTRRGDGALRGAAVVARPGSATRRWCARAARSPSSRARHWWCAPTWRPAPTCSTRSCAAAKTSISCGGSGRRAGTCGSSRRVVSNTTGRPTSGPSWPARPSTGPPPARWRCATVRPSPPCTRRRGHWRSGSSRWRDAPSSHRRRW